MDLYFHLIYERTNNNLNKKPRVSATGCVAKIVIYTLTVWTFIEHFHCRICITKTLRFNGQFFILNYVIVMYELGRYVLNSIQPNACFLVSDHVRSRLRVFTKMLESLISLLKITMTVRVTSEFWHDLWLNWTSFYKDQYAN